MKMFEFKSRLARRAAATIALGLLLGAQTAMACTVGNWNGGTSGAGVLASGPDGPDGKPAISRYSGVCAMQAAESSSEWVQDNSPGGIERIRARFYLLNDLAAGQSAQIYRGFSSTTGSGPLFTVTMNDAGQVVLRDNTVVQNVSQSSGSKWTSVEIDWSQGSGTGVISLSVNGQSPDVLSTLNNAGSSLQSIRLGNLNGAGGALNFDAYESRRTTEIGRLCVGDADGSGERGLGDLQAIFEEFQFGTLASGQPDADENGDVGLGDLQTVFEIFQFGTPACPT